MEGRPLPLVQLHIVEGRPDDVKRRLIAEVTDAVSRTLGSKPESIRVLLYELPKQHWAVGGQSLAERDL
jgi:4-oxalocrotonate tautomerase